MLHELQKSPFHFWELMISTLIWESRYAFELVSHDSFSIKFLCVGCSLCSAISWADDDILPAGLSVRIETKSFKIIHDAFQNIFCNMSLSMINLSTFLKSDFCINQSIKLRTCLVAELNFVVLYFCLLSTSKSPYQYTKWINKYETLGVAMELRDWYIVIMHIRNKNM